MSSARLLSAISAFEVVAHVGVGLVGEHLTRLGDVLLRGAPQPVRIDERLELGVPPARVPRGPAITGRVDPGQVGFQPLELSLEIVELLEHAPRVPARAENYWRLLIRVSMPPGPSADCSANVSSILWKSSLPKRSAIARGIAGNE